VYTIVNFVTVTFDMRKFSVCGTSWFMGVWGWKRYNDYSYISLLSINSLHVQYSISLE